MKKQLLFTILCLTGWQLNAQVFQAAYQFASPDHDQSQAVATDAAGNVYTAGIYRGYFLRPGIRSATMPTAASTASPTRAARS